MAAVWMIDRERCKGRGLCTVACPKKLLELGHQEPNGKGYYPVEMTDMTACVACASCAKICPDSAISVGKE